MENLIEPTNEVTNAYYQEQGEKVYTAIEQIKSCIADKRRIEKIQELKEDQGIAKQRGARLISFNDNAYANFRDAPTPPLMKATLYDQMYRKIFAQNFDLNRMSPKKSPQYEALEPFLLGMKDQVIEDGDLQGLQQEILLKKFDEGTVFVSVGCDEVVEPEIHDYENVFWDVTATSMRKKGRASRGTARWMATKAIMSRGAFEEYLDTIDREDLKGRVAGGDVIGSQENEDDSDINYNDPVTVYTFYSIAKGHVFKLTFGGVHGVELQTLENEDYKYKLQGRKVIPMLVFQADPMSHLFTSQSFIGLIKDGAEALKKTLNTFLLSIPRSINTWNLLVGDTSGKMIEDMKLFNAISDIGGTPMISSSSTDTDIKTIKPASVYNDFKVARETILDELGSKIGIQFRIQESTSQRATIFVEQRRDENEATQMQKKLDKRANEELMEMSVTLTIENGDLDGDLYIDFGKNGILTDPKQEKSFVYELLSDWGGYFEADVTIDETLTTTQKINSYDNVQATINNIFTTIGSIRPSSVEAIKPLIDVVYAKIVALKLEKDVTKEELLSMYGDFINNLTPEQDVQEQNVPSVEDGQITAEMAQEVPASVQGAV